jgi:hypothetical protein
MPNEANAQRSDAQRRRQTTCRQGNTEAASDGVSASWAAVILMIIVSWGWSGQGRGWGRNNQLAHMMPPAVSSTNGPATRSGMAGLPPNGR